MLKLFTIASALLFCIVAFGQPTFNINSGIQKNKKSVQSTEETILKKTIIRYNYTSASDSVIEQKKVFTYDNSGNETSYINDFWDSSANAYYHNEKTENTFDSNNNHIKYEYWYGENDQWIQNQQRLWEYNSNNQQIREVVKSYNSQNSNWDMIEIHRNDYSPEGYLTIETDSVRQDINVWSITRNRFLYDQNGNDTTIINEMWYDQLNNWTPLTKTSNKFDDKNRVVETLVSDENPATKYTWHYNASGLVDTFALYIYNIGQTNWFIHSKLVYTFSGKGELTQLDQFAQNQQNNQIEKVREVDYTYDENGNKTSELTKSKNQNNGGLENTSKTDYEYNTNKQVVSTIQYSWQSATNTWQKLSTNLKTYKNELLKTETFLNYSYSIPAWREFTFYNNEALTSVPKFETADAFIYPNPVADILTVYNPELKFKNIEIYSLSGRVIKSQVLESSSCQINLSAFKNGVYIAVLANGKNTKSLRFIKQK